MTISATIHKAKEFSLFDFCKKRADKVQLFGKESLDEEGNVIPFIDQAALITHYLQLRNTNVKLSYKRWRNNLHLPIEIWPIK